MGGFDAISHAFSTIAIGGFSTHDASIGYFDSEWVKFVAVIFMLLAGMNFSLHFLAWRSLKASIYFQDPEIRAYLFMHVILAAITVLYLYFTDTFTSISAALAHGVFQAVSIGTTTGFTSAEYYAWPGFLPVMLLFSSFIGGCAGSTGGGMKVIRALLLYKQGVREISRLIHPNALITVKVGGKSMAERVISSVWGFFALYVASFTFFLLLMMAMGMDQVTAFSAVAACINNLGPGLGDVGAHYANIGDGAKWILGVAMIMGRLEIFTLLVLFTTAFWKK